MSKIVRHVLKAHEVVQRGPFQLSLDPAAGCAGAGPASTPAKVRIVESHPDHAIIELTCPCGRQTRMRCEYEAASQTATEGPASV